MRVHGPTPEVPVDQSVAPVTVSERIRLQLDCVGISEGTLRFGEAICMVCKIP